MLTRKHRPLFATKNMCALAHGSTKCAVVPIRQDGTLGVGTIGVRDPLPRSICVLSYTRYEREENKQWQREKIAPWEWYYRCARPFSKEYLCALLYQVSNTREQAMAKGQDCTLGVVPSVRGPFVTDMCVLSDAKYRTYGTWYRTQEKERCQ